LLKNDQNIQFHKIWALFIILFQVITYNVYNRKVLELPVRGGGRRSCMTGGGGGGAWCVMVAALDVRLFFLGGGGSG
jgi:hypothetical protein